MMFVCILEVAEFLMIEKLKALCIQNLKATKVILENCMQLLIRYDFLLEEVRVLSSTPS